MMLRWAVRLNVGLKSYPHLSRFLERMYSDPSVRKAVVEEEGEASEYARAPI